MADPIVPFALSAPGFYGLNLADSPVELSPNFALEANNCVIDRAGRIASRQGWTKANTTSTDLGTEFVECMGELIENSGTATTLCAGNGFLFKLASGALTTLTYGGGGVAPTISANNWQFCQLNGVAIFWQEGYDPLIYDPAVSTTTFRRLNEKTGTVGSIPQCNASISAFGRVWAAGTTSDKQTIAFSDLLAPHIWSTGTSGTLDVSTVWAKGGDTITALASHNNYLIVFGRKQILIYQGATSPSTMMLSDTIVGVGCIARDTIQATGTDLLFLSDAGVQSLQRVIQEKSAPVVQISGNVREDIQAYVTAESGVIKSGFSAVHQLYLLTFTTANITYCFDTRAPLQNGSLRVTVWPQYTSRSFLETVGRKFYIGKPGAIAAYGGYIDDTSTYRMTYFTSWIDFGNPIQTSILKRIIATLIGGAQRDVVFKWAYDFSRTYYSSVVNIGGGNTAEFNIAEYNDVWEYTPGVEINRLQVPGAGSGRVLQFGFDTIINNRLINVQKIEIYTKEGRI